MAHLHCDFTSESLGMVTAINAVLPEQGDLGEARVIYLLHGLQDNCSGWSRYTAVERYAREKNAVLIMPEVQRSFYADMAWGPNYFTYVLEELPRVCRRMFGLSSRRELNYIMGLSMGGYGALKCALTAPERYAGCAAFSAVADLPLWAESCEPQMKKELRAIFGPERTVPESCDLFALARKADPETAPRIRTYCGEQDALLEPNQRFADLLRDLGFHSEFRHWEGGHEWPFWDRAVEQAINALLD